MGLRYKLEIFVAYVGLRRDVAACVYSMLLRFLSNYIFCHIAKKKKHEPWLIENI